MMKRMFTTVAAAAALTATPVMAQSIEIERAPASVEQDAEQFGASGGGIIIAVLALAAIIAGIVIAVDGEEDGDLPTSP